MCRRHCTTLYINYRFVPYFIGKSILLTPDMLSLGPSIAQRQKPLRVIGFRANSTPETSQVCFGTEAESLLVYYNLNTYWYVFQCARSNTRHVYINMLSKSYSKVYANTFEIPSVKLNSSRIHYLSPGKL